MALPARNKLLIGAGGFVGLLVAALFALPALLDVNAYKPTLIAGVKQATGRDLAIDGAIRLSLLPLPEVTLGGVRFANVPGAKDPDMVTARSIVVRLSLPALLTGTIAASEATLVAPTFNLEVDAAGQANWVFGPDTGAAGPLPVNTFRVDGGTLSYSDARTGLVVAASRLNVAGSVASVAGPVSLAGSTVVADTPIAAHLVLSAKGPAGYTADIAFEAAGGRIAYAGSLSELAPEGRLSGKLSASADNLVGFVEALFKVAGRPRPYVPPLLAGKVSFEGPIEASPTAVAARDFTLGLGGDTATGSVTATLAPALAVEARFKAARLDLDRWLQTLALPAPVPDEKLQEVAGSGAASSAPASPTNSTAASRPPPAAPLRARLGLEVGELVYNQQPIRGLALDVEARDGVVAVPTFNVTLPGDLVVHAASTISGPATRPSVAGAFSLEGPKLRETLAWLRVDTSRVPPGKLARVALRGRMGSRDGDIQVDDATFEIDELKGRAGLTVDVGLPASMELRLDLATVDLNAFVRPDGEAASTAAPDGDFVPILALLGPSLGLKLRVARIEYRGEVISGVDMDVSRHTGTLRLKNFKVASLAGARIDVRGAVTDYWTPQPRANVAFSFESPDIDRVLALAGAPPTGFGSVAASGNAAGSWASLDIKEGAVSALGSTVKASGALAVVGVPQRKITSIAYKGSVVVDGQPMTVSVAAALKDRPDITADIQTEVFDFDRFLQRRAQGRSRAKAEEIDTASLRSFDGKLTLTTSRVAAGSPGRPGLGDIAVTLKDGTLTLLRLKGGLHGGELDLAGVVDATQPALSFELKGSARGLRIGEMMRSSSGTNEVGSMIRITLDGVLNADDIVLRGKGTTMAELDASLAGGARLGGYIQPRADRFMQMIGAAATGVTGGAIDLTLGNIARLFGDKGGIGVGNLLNAISLVLNRFVNHDDSLSGGVDIAGGVLTGRDLRVQGSGATASISTRTELGNATTDTTVYFTLNEEPSTPYLIMTARGPLSGPSFSAVRGGASDPPGMPDILSTIEKVPSLLPSISLPSFHIPNPFGR